MVLRYPLIYLVESFDVIKNVGAGGWDEILRAFFASMNQSALPVRDTCVRLFVNLARLSPMDYY